MANTTDVSDKIIQALAEYLNGMRRPSSRRTTCGEDLGLDSMAVIEMLYRIEGLQPADPDQDLLGLTTVGHVIGYVQGRVAPAQAKTAAKTPAKTSTKTATKKPAAKRSTKSKRPNRMSTAPRPTPLTLRELHEYVGGELVGSPEATVIGVASLDQAGPRRSGVCHLRAPSKSPRRLPSAHY